MIHKNQLHKMNGFHEPRGIPSKFWLSQQVFSYSDQTDRLNFQHNWFKSISLIVCFFLHSLSLICQLRPLKSIRIEISQKRLLTWWKQTSIPTSSKI